MTLKKFDSLLKQGKVLKQDTIFLPELRQCCLAILVINSCWSVELPLQPSMLHLDIWNSDSIKAFKQMEGKNRS